MHGNDQRQTSVRIAIARNLGLALLVVCIENLLIFSGIGFSSAGTRGGQLIGPIPGWIIGVAWTTLFAGLGVVRGVMETDGSDAARRASRAVLVLLVACAAYPVYTCGLRNAIVGIFGNLATIALSFWVAIQTGRAWRLGAIVPMAVIAWVAFATLAMVDQGLVFG